MEGFTYHNIFETKGIEYIVILGFFALLIPFWIILNKRVDLKKSVRRLIGALTPSTLKVPQGVFFSRNHTWTHLGRSGAARVGIDDLLVHLTGELKVVFFIKPGEIIQKGNLLANINHEGKLLRILSPISGEVLAINQAIKQNPDILSKDPMGKGWLYSIKPTNWVEETKSYYLAEAATEWTTAEISRVKDFIASRAANNQDAQQLILQDGGELRDNTLSDLPLETWQDFQNRFLSQLD
jgi:glycine cleavage system H protein